MSQEHIEYHRNGSLRAKGLLRAGQPEGFWQWFRLDGTTMRSGYFADGRPVGQWTTYDQQGRVYKVTVRR